VPRLLLPLVAVSALALVGCSSPGPAATPEPSAALGPAPSASAPAEPAPSESAATAEGDPDAPEGYPVSAAVSFPECAALEGAVAPLTSGLDFDQAVSAAQDQEDVVVERQCAWVDGDATMRLTLSGIEFTPQELVALSGSRLVVPDAAANERGLFVMGVGEPPVLSERYAGSINVFDQFHTVSVGWSGRDSGFTGQQAVDAAVAVHEILRR
jgi:hypothetical protein